MKLVRISIRNFRGIAESSVEFDAGITVIEGPNEAGKSSIPEAIRLLRELKHTSRHGDLRAVQPVGRDVGPEVELELASGDYQLTYRKRWLKSPVAELSIHSPRAEQLSGDAAHERFLQVLAETVDDTLLKALEVSQGASMDQAKLADIQVLHRALGDSEAGDDGQDQLLAAVDEEYERYFTPTGRSKSDLATAISRVAELTGRVAELEESERQIEGFAEQHAATTERSSRLKEQQQEAARELQDWQERGAQLKSLELLVEQAESQYGERIKQRDLAAERLADRERLVADRRDRKRARKQARKEAADVATRHETAAQALSAAEANLSRSKESLEQARREVRNLETVVSQHRTRAEKLQLSERIEDAHAARDKRVATRAELAELKVDDPTLKQLTELETNVRLATRAQEAAAAKVTVRRLGDHTVEVNAQPLPAAGDHELAVIQEVQIEVPDILEVRVLPGQPQADLDRDAEDAKKALTDGLEEAGVESLEDARSVAARRRELELELQRAETSLEAILRQDQIEDLEERLAVLANKLGEEDLELGLPEAEDGLENAQGILEEAEKGHSKWQEKYETSRGAESKASEDLVRMQVKADAAEQEADRVKQQLKDARETRSDTALNKALGEAKEQVAAAKTKLGEAVSKLEEMEPDDVSLGLDNAEQLVERCKEDADQAAKEITSLEAVLEDRASQGVHDTLIDARAELDAAQSLLARLERRSQAARLLYETLHRHRDQTLERYVQPFREHIESIGRHLFQSAFTVEINRDLEIVSRTLDGQTVPFGSLSAGAREQLALLGRLACAKLVDPTQGAPVILDDSLGFADPERLRAFNRVLNFVGNEAQIVLLTCQPDRFAHVGGARTVQLNRARP